MEFETTFPDLGPNTLTKNRHGDRLGLLTPDPQVISRKLFTRIQSNPAACNAGFGLPDNSARRQLRLPEGAVLQRPGRVLDSVHDARLVLAHGGGPQRARSTWTWAARPKLVNNVETPLTPEEIQKLGCRPGDRVDKTYVLTGFAAGASSPRAGKDYLARAPKTFTNNNTAWWDASQIYGYDETSRKRVKRDPKDPAKMLLEPVAGGSGGRLPARTAAGRSDAAAVGAARNRWRFPTTGRSA